MTALKSERAEWLRRVLAWTRSGLALRAFAEREGLSTRSLTWWRWRLTKDGDVPAPTTTALALSFVEVHARPAPVAPGFEVVLQNGRVVRVQAAFDDAALARLLAVVDEVAR